MSPNYVRAATACVVLGWLMVAASAGAPPRDEDKEKPEERFEKLLAVAMKDPSKVDWKALRLKFADNEAYAPYSVQWRDDLQTVGQKLKDGDAAGAEALLKTVLERDRYMRLEAHVMAGMLYNKTGRKEKELWHQEFIKGMFMALVDGGKGLSFEEPIEVLFIEEEYFFLQMLDLKGKRQPLTEHDGHKFDIYTIAADGANPERKFYFRVDLPQKAAGRSLKSFFEAAEKKEKKSDAVPKK